MSSARDRLHAAGSSRAASTRYSRRHRRSGRQDPGGAAATTRTHHPAIADSLLASAGAAAAAGESHSAPAFDTLVHAARLFSGARCRNASASAGACSSHARAWLSAPVGDGGGAGGMQRLAFRAYAGAGRWCWPSPRQRAPPPGQARAASQAQYSDTPGTRRQPTMCAHVPVPHLVSSCVSGADAAVGSSSRPLRPGDARRSIASWLSGYWWREGGRAGRVPHAPPAQLQLMNGLQCARRRVKPDACHATQLVAAPPPSTPRCKSWGWNTPGARGHSRAPGSCWTSCTQPYLGQIRCPQARWISSRPLRPASVQPRRPVGSCRPQGKKAGAAWLA